MQSQIIETAATIPRATSFQTIFIASTASTSSTDDSETETPTGSACTFLTELAGLIMYSVWAVLTVDIVRSQLLVNQGENTRQNQLPALILMNDTLIRGSEEMRELTLD